MEYMTKEEFDELLCKGAVSYRDEKRVIRNLTNAVISSLYRLDPDLVLRIKKSKWRKFNLDRQDVIIECSGVIKGSYEWVVYVDGVKNKELEKYIERWLKRWGWNATVITTE